MSRPCAVCGDPFTNIDTEWHPYTTHTATGWTFHQHEAVHTWLCHRHHDGNTPTPMPRMVAYRGPLERLCDKLENNGTGSRANDKPAPSARPTGGPTDER